jgi:hypothetical protein
VYSDGLLTLLLKKRLKDTYGDEAASVNVNIANTIQIPRANTYEDWLRMTTLDHAALPAPSDIQDADFTSVLPPPHEDPAMADIL